MENTQEAEIKEKYSFCTLFLISRVSPVVLKAYIPMAYNSCEDSWELMTSETSKNHMWKPYN